MTLLFCTSSIADTTDFNTWTLVEDPVHPNFESSVDTASQVTLTANDGPIPAGTDIGYQSVNGPTPLSSTQGYYFDTSSDFSIAVDFAMNFNSPNGTLAFGFGIGEDQTGVNSAGVTLVTSNGIPLSFVAASRINDVTQTPVPISGIAAQSAARMIASYDAASGNLQFGISNNGDDIAEASHTFVGLQNDWTDGPLLVSFFLRSDTVSIFTPWNSGSSDTTVTNFQVISGSAVSVPEPQSVVFILGLTMYRMSRRKRR